MIIINHHQISLDNHLKNINIQFHLSIYLSIYRSFYLIVLYLSPCIKFHDEGGLRCTFIKYYFIWRAYIWFDMIHNDIICFKGWQQWKENKLYTSRSCCLSRWSEHFQSPAWGWGKFGYEEQGVYNKLYVRVSEIMECYIWFNINVHIVDMMFY